MVVLFDGVKDYIADKLSSQDVDARVDGAGRGLILQLSPAPRFTCTVEVTNGQPGDSFQCAAANQQNQVMHQAKFKGRTHRFTDVPNDYFLTVTHATAAVEPVGSPAADLYEDCAVQFVKRPAMPGGVGFNIGGPSTSETSLNVAGIDGPLEVRDLSTGSVFSSRTGVFRRKLKPGPYLIKAKDQEGMTVRKERVVLDLGATRHVDLKTLARSSFRDDILRQLPAGAYTPDAVHFSESLGALTDDEPALWLSLLGAARIVGDGDGYSKLQGFKLHTFERYHEGNAPVYVLAGFAEPRRLAVQVSNSAKHVKRLAEAVPKLPRVQQAAFKRQPGFRLLWLHPEGLASFALATHGMPNRATFVVLAEDDSGTVALRHFILPIHTLTQHLDPHVRTYFPSGSVLETVKFIARAQRNFERHLPIEPNPRKARPIWEQLLYAKWVDPIMAIVASCELIRRGKTNMIPTVVDNLRRYFPGLPDTEGLARLAGLDWKLPATPPMLLECLQALGPDLQLPLPHGKLDYRGPWTVWRGADD
jgi:hypothetical protein